METIGKKLRALRLGADMSIRELADKCQSSNPYICNVEQEKLIPHLAIISRIANALGYDTYIKFVPKGAETSFTEDDLLYVGEIKDKRFNK